MPVNKDQTSPRWRQGYTTGSCAAGAAKAACLLLKGENPPLTSVTIPLPDSSRLTMPVHYHELNLLEAKAVILKDGGDDPDITHGLEIQATARLISDQGNVRLSGGLGVGTVTKKGLAISVGEKAINPIPRIMIEAAVREVFPKEEVEIFIEVPEGEKTALHTLNPRLGILGGISILGTTGIVRPMSEEAFKTSLIPQLDQAVAYGCKTIILTPGNYGFKVASEYLKAPQEAIIQMSNFVGYLLEEAVEHKIERVILLGHIGKLIKVAGGIFHTHNRVADARMEILVAHAALNGVSTKTLHDLATFPTTEGAAQELIALGKQSILHKLAKLASQRVQDFLHQRLRVGTVLTLLSGQFVGWDDQAQEIITQEGWLWP
ncbi:MAG: cobalt-precorrin-5B (C(1))-methyltransferase CbiD [Desulfitobacteriaceae bacterium]